MGLRVPGTPSLTGDNNYGVLASRKLGKGGRDSNLELGSEEHGSAQAGKRPFRTPSSEGDAALSTGNLSHDPSHGLVVDADLDVYSLWFRTSDVLNGAALR